MNILYTLEQTVGQAKPYEIVVAILIVVISTAALFFLYRNVIFHFKQNKLERDSLTKEKLNDDSMLDKLTSSVSVNHLLAQINEDIKTAMKAKEAEKLEALRAIKSQLLLLKTSGSGKEITKQDEISL